MRLTNKLNLPQPIVEAIANSGYSKGLSRFTATSLIEPTQISILKERHAEELEEDAADLIYSLQGQSIHTILERAALKLSEQGYISERRFYIEVNGVTVGAQIDVFHKPTGKLQDYKVTSLYSVKEGAKEEYVKQLNIQAYIIKNGYEIIDGKKHYHHYKVKELEIVAILRDWSKAEAERSPELPQHQVTLLAVPIIPEHEVLGYIKERVLERLTSLELPSAMLPECSAEERWAKPDVWAIMKKGLKRAVRLCYNAEAAQIALEAAGPGHSIVFRQGVSTRCERYCPVKNKCSQYKKMQETKTENSDES